MASSPRIDELRKKFEENPRRYFAPLANEYRKAGEIEQAIAICREHLPQQPGHMSGHIVFGQALFEAKQLDEAKTVFETALSLDPENLIALRHLGDIALAAGDKEGAKGWYKRVLEADPRNEETQAQLAAIEGGAKVPPPAAVPETMSTAKTVPLATAGSSAPTVVMKAVTPPAAAKPAAPPAAAKPAAPVSSDSPTAEIRLDGLTRSEPPATKSDAGMTDIPATLIMDAPHGVTPVAAHEVPAVAATVGLEATSLAAPSDAPIEAFSLEGLETTSLASPPPAPPAPEPTPVIDLEIPAPSPAAVSPEPPPAAAPAATGTADLPMIDLDFGTPAPAAESPAATVPASPAQAAEPVDVIELELPESRPQPPMPSAPAASSPAPPVAAEVPPLVDLDLGAAAEAAAPTPTLESAPASEVPTEAAPVPEPAGPFVTETMAQLYLQQGHREEALGVYRALLEQRPGDSGLMAKIAELEGPAPPPIPETSAAAPTIRAVLQLVALRRPGYRPEPLQGNGASPGANVAAEPPPMAGGTDGLSAVLGDVAPAPEEEAAAMVLATAFADLTGASHAEGALDYSGAVAGSPAAPEMIPPGAAVGPPSSFSFDKFFSQRVTAEHAGTGVATEAPVESPEDVAKFTQWLEGLKNQ